MKTLKTCPYCAEEVQLEAIKCRFCGEWFEEKPEKETIKVVSIEPIPVVKHSEKASPANQREADQFVNQSAKLIQKGKLDQAEALLKKALQKDPEHALAHNNYGVVLLEKGDAAMAARYFKTAAQLSPDDKLAMDNLDVAKINMSNGALSIYKSVWLSEKEILRKTIAAFQKHGLYCQAVKQKEGTINTYGGGVLLGSGDLAVGFGKSDIEVEVWNPFIVKNNAFSWWAAKIYLYETNTLFKTIDQYSYEGRDVTIEREFLIDKTNVSFLGCLLAIPGLILSGIFLISGELPASIIMFLILCAVPYWIGKGVMTTISRLRPNKRNALNDSLIDVFKTLHQELKTDEAS